MYNQQTHPDKFIDALKNSTVFQDFDKMTLQKLLLKMTHKHWKAGQFFNNYQGGLHEFYFICSGRVKEYQIDESTGREHTFFMLQQGDIFDVMNLLDNKPHEMYWETLDDVEALSITKPLMKEWISAYPMMHDDLYNYLGQRMRQLEEKVSDIIIHNTLIRLSKLLLCHITGNPPELKLINNLSNKEIAALIGTTRAVVNRHLQELKNSGAIDLDRKQIRIHDINKLIDIAEEKYDIAS